jgi:hypothetical protein
VTAGVAEGVRQGGFKNYKKYFIFKKKKNLLEIFLELENFILSKFTL